MITLNLISPAKKQQFKLEQIYIIIKNIIILLLLSSIIIAIALLITKNALQLHFQKIVEQTTLTTQYANTFSAEVRDFNRIINAVSAVQENYTDWNAFLVNFSAITPNGIVIKNLLINETHIIIKGVADTRDSLLNFKNNLEESVIFSNVEIPIDNLLERTNIEFDIKAAVDLDHLSL